MVTVGLLEYLQLKVGCMYLSDLHLPTNLLLVQRAVLCLDPEDYSLEEWDDAVKYITGQAIPFTDVKQATLFLQNYRQEA